MGIGPSIHAAARIGVWRPPVALRSHRGEDNLKNTGLHVRCSALPRPHRPASERRTLRSRRPPSLRRRLPFQALRVTGCPRCCNQQTVINHKFGDLPNIRQTEPARACTPNASPEYRNDTSMEHRVPAGAGKLPSRDSCPCRRVQSSPGGPAADRLYSSHLAPSSGFWSQKVPPAALRLPPRMQPAWWRTYLIAAGSTYQAAFAATAEQRTSHPGAVSIHWSTKWYL